MEWRGDDILASIEAAVFDGLIAAATVYAQRMREELGRHDGEGPSQPGEAPHKQSAQAARRGRPPLADSVEIWLDRKEFMVGVGSRSPHALALELGSAGVAARPAWLAVAIDSRYEMERALYAAVGKYMARRGAG